MLFNENNVNNSKLVETSVKLAEEQFKGSIKAIDSKLKNLSASQETLRERQEEFEPKMNDIKKGFAYLTAAFKDKIDYREFDNFKEKINMEYAKISLCDNIEYNI